MEPSAPSKGQCRALNRLERFRKTEQAGTIEICLDLEARNQTLSSHLTKGCRDTGTQSHSHRDTQTQGHRVTGTWGQKDTDTGTWKHRDIESQGYGTQSHRDTQTQKHGVTGTQTQGHRVTGTQRHRYAGKQSQRIQWHGVSGTYNKQCQPELQAGPGCRGRSTV